MQWFPITDLPEDWQPLKNDELQSLITVWEDQAERLRNSGEFNLYMERLRREIAIETGIIERLYDIDRGITRVLIERGIDASLIPHGATDRPAAKVVALIKDQEAAIEGLFDFVGGQRTLTTSYIKQLHQLLTRNQEYTEALNPSTGQLVQIPLRRGDWKLHPNNPLRLDESVHEYSPPEQVASEMDSLIHWHQQHQGEGVSPEVEAAWLHHRFTQIHPFQDGNGRVARCLASLVFIREKWFPLVLTRDDRTEYIHALEKADEGNIRLLVDLFAKRQQRAFVRSLSLSEQVLSEFRQTKAVIASVADRLRQQPSTTEKEQILHVERYAEILHDIAEDRLIEVAEEITLSLQGILTGIEVSTTNAIPNGERSGYYHYQVVETAKQLNYFANLRNYHGWTQLFLNVERPTIILISLHVLGKEYRGILACSACAYHLDTTEEENTVTEIQALTDSPFQFSYADDEENLTTRYKRWLEEAVVAGLEYWNKSL